MVIERAKRLVEHKRDVVILRVITRGARLQHRGAQLRSSPAASIQRPAAALALGAARRPRNRFADDLATALIDTGSKMDEGSTEFKGTGNMEYPTRRTPKRVYPAININRLAPAASC